MSNVHQTTITFSVIGWREVEQVDLAELMLPTDRAAVFSVAPSGRVGFVIVGRPLLYNFMSLHFGADPTLKRHPTPERDFTRIELRFYRRLVRQLLEQLERSWSAVTPVALSMQLLQGRDCLLEEPHERVMLATFDVGGFGEVCRLRVAVPWGPFADVEVVTKAVQHIGCSPVEDTVLEAPLDLRVELASIYFPLSRLSELRVGELIEINAACEDETLLVKVAGTPKFRGIRGTVGQRVAVQLTERL